MVANGVQHLKSEVVVSFFTGPVLAVDPRRCPFSASSHMALQQKDTGNMCAYEYFACYRDASGAVVALDEFGICGNGIAFSAVKPAIHKAPGR